MEMSADGSHSSDLQKQLGLRHIVNIQGPFFQRGPNDCGGDQQKNQTTTASSASSADNNEMQGSTSVRKTALRVGAAIAEGQLLAGNNSAQHRPEQMSNLQQQSSHHTKHLVDEVDEEEDDDGDADPSVRISNSEQTGRWTRKEHEVFLEALKKFGKVMIASYVKY